MRIVMFTLSWLLLSSFLRAETLKLHVPSPDWRQQIVYGLMIDRFNNGDHSNDDQGQGEFNPKESSYYSGGDIVGITQKLDYLQKLGVTAVWLTPPMRNKWTDPGDENHPAYTGYHGYWPVDFTDVDAHYGSLADYKWLSSELHKRGMYLIQDAVVNHVAHFYHYNGPYDPTDVKRNFSLLTDVSPSAPLTPPFDKIDLMNPEHETANIYHWTPPIIDYENPTQLTTYQLELVNDINTSNQVAREALKKAYRFWIEEVGVDGFRLDAAKHVEDEFWRDFLHADNGIEAAAEKLGKSDFFTFGEAWRFSQPYEDTGEHQLLEMLGSPEEPEIKTVIGFPLFSEMDKVFNAQKPTRYLSYRLNAHMRVYPKPYLIPNFLDNHDVARFLRDGKIEAFKQALTTLFTIPGIPIVFQGDEQGFLLPRQSMFSEGFAGPDKQFNTNHDLYKTIQQLAELRKNHSTLAIGGIETLIDTDTGPGILAYQRFDKDGQYFIIHNTADHRALLNGLKTGAGIIKVLFATNSAEKHIPTRVYGSLTTEIPARASVIFRFEPKHSAQTQTSTIEVQQQYNNATLQSDSILTGSNLDGSNSLLLVVDGNLDTAISIQTDKKGRWQTLLPISDVGGVRHYFELYDPLSKTASRQQSYIASRKPDYVVNRLDETGDLGGRTGLYQKPLHPAIGQQMDIKGVKAEVAGSKLYLTLSMADVTNHWAYINGFENVAFHIYFDFGLPSGATVLPELQATTPEYFKWQSAHYLSGFVNQIFSHSEADASNKGSPLPQPVGMSVDTNNDMIQIIYDINDMGQQKWQGTKLYISTWDRDHNSKLRPLSKDAGTWTFGGNVASGPLILDDILLIIPNG